MLEILGGSVYVLCAILSLLCAVALFRGYNRSQNRLLLWSGLCFVFLVLNNVFLCIDLLIFPDMNLNGPMWRALLSAVASMLLLFGLITEMA